MATELQLAQAIETQFTFNEITLSICRPNMAAALSEGNPPYVHALNEVSEQTATGIIQNEFWGLAFTGNNNGRDLIKGIKFNQRYGTHDCFISGEANSLLDQIKFINHPAGNEFDNLWPAIVNHLISVRNALEPTIQRIQFVVGSPVYGRIGCMVVENSRAVWKNFTITATYGAGWVITSMQQV